jgi:hypothetical protein
MEDPMRATLAAVILATLVVAAPAPASAALTPPESPGLASPGALGAGAPGGAASLGAGAPGGAVPAARLERTCAVPAAAHRMRCMAVRRVDIAGRDGNAPDASPGGYTPADLRDAYDLPTARSTATIAIVDAYDDPQAESDLAVYRERFNLPACTTGNGCFRKVNQNGSSTNPPARSTDWAGEISLDLDMASAVCPTCHLLLVEADSNNDGDLFHSINQAVRMGAKFVSNSWGGAEDPSQTSFDRSALDHPGVVITASTGDDGYGAQFPAASRFVTAVGGTTLRRSGNGRGWSESVWGGAGSGCSRYDARPAWQPAMSACGRRAMADVSAVADPSTGVAVYQSYGGSGWSIYGGTSVAAPIVAAVYALGGTPAAGDYPASYPYRHASSLNDVTSGSNGSCATLLCQATSGWDGPTGLGTPHGVAAFSPAPACPSGNLLTNGGFEGGASVGWTAPTGAIAQGTSGTPARSGSWLARLDGTGTTHKDTVSQPFAIPAGCGSGTLTMWVRVDTAERTTTTAFDLLRVRVGIVGGADQTGTVTLATRSNLDAGGYTKISVDVSQYAGSSVVLTISGAEDGSLATTFSVDDVAVTAGAAAAGR